MMRTYKNKKCTVNSFALRWRHIDETVHTERSGMTAWEPKGLSDKNSRSVTEAAYDRLRRDLMSGRLPPGGRLKINDLCLAMGLNLSAVR